MGWDDVGLISKRTWKRVEVRQGRVFFGDKELKHRWVRFKQEHSDGYQRYQKGQVVELRSRDVLMSHLEDGYCVPCDPEEPVTKDPYRDSPTADYRCIESAASDRGEYKVGSIYTLAVPRGDKLVDRGIMVRVNEAEKRQDPNRRKS